MSLNELEYIAVPYQIKYSNTEPVINFSCAIVINNAYGLWVGLCWGFINACFACMFQIVVQRWGLGIRHLRGALQIVQL